VISPAAGLDLATPDDHPNQVSVSRALTAGIDSMTMMARTDKDVRRATSAAMRRRS
jgi:hypothetical protein